MFAHQCIRCINFCWLSCSKKDPTVEEEEELLETRTNRTKKQEQSQIVKFQDTELVDVQDEKEDIDVPLADEIVHIADNKKTTHHFKVFPELKILKSKHRKKLLITHNKENDLFTVMAYPKPNAKAFISSKSILDFLETLKHLKNCYHIYKHVKMKGVFCIQRPSENHIIGRGVMFTRSAKIARLITIKRYLELNPDRNWIENKLDNISRQKFGELIYDYNPCGMYVMCTVPQHVCFDMFHYSVIPGMSKFTTIQQLFRQCDVTKTRRATVVLMQDEMDAMTMRDTVTSSY